MQGYRKAISTHYSSSDNISWVSMEDKIIIDDVIALVERKQKQTGDK
jgi:hypothetical protein